MGDPTGQPVKKVRQHAAPLKDDDPFGFDAYALRLGTAGSIVVVVGRVAYGVGVGWR